MWGGLPSLRLQVLEVPRHGWLVESDEVRLRPGAEILPSLLSTTPSYLKYLHDDTETTADQLSLSLWLLSSGNNRSTEDESSTWLLNITLPVVILPVNDQPFHVVLAKAPPQPVVQVSLSLGVFPSFLPFLLSSLGVESHGWFGFMCSLTYPKLPS